MIEVLAVLMLIVFIYFVFHYRREIEAQEEYETLREKHGFDKDFDYDFSDLDHP